MPKQWIKIALQRADVTVLASRPLAVRYVSKLFFHLVQGIGGSQGVDRKGGSIERFIGFILVAKLCCEKESRLWEAEILELNHFMQSKHGRYRQHEV